MKQLTWYDIEDMRAAVPAHADKVVLPRELAEALVYQPYCDVQLPAGEGPVTFSREMFDELTRGYAPYHPRHTVGFTFNILREVSRLTHANG